jgi:NAD(P)-dependent dehydrogenase (short-subunit alcohol dehydrogenase family)
VPRLRFAAPVERRVAVVTGGAQGIGRATVLRLAEAGRDVVIADLDPAGAQVAAAAADLGVRARFFPTDVTDEAAVLALAGAAREELGRLDILVCSAGILGLEAPFEEQSAAQFEKVMRINVLGVYLAHQACLPAMLAGGWGRCVSFTSGARHGQPNQVPYAVSKAAVHGFVRSLGGCYARRGVFVNAVEPSRSLTQMVVPRFSAEHLADPGTPLGRYADPEEIAEVVEFLCSERNTHVSGAIWEVKGGVP